MEFFLNETSLNQQFNSIEEFKKAIISINAIFSLIEEKRKNDVFYQDSWLFQADYKALKEEIFQSSFSKINPNLRLDFTRFLNEGLKAKDWRAERVHSENDYFYYDNPNNLITNTTLAEVAERNLQRPDIQRLVINFIESQFKKLDQIQVFKNDEKQISPINLDCLDSKMDLEKWLDIDIPQSILKDQTRFVKTPFLFKKSGKGTPIYKEIATGYYWYPDHFHQTNKFHFEVFDEQIRHLGEADLNGNIIPNTADPDKHGKLSL